jgi:Zn-dependent M28 family amino/carboxypeptidase
MEKMVQNGLMSKVFLLFLAFSLLLVSCKEEKSSIPQAKLVVPVFNVDSAYAFIEKQIDFGPRVPGTDAQIACKEWIKSKMNAYGAKVIEQKYSAVIFNGEEKPGYNIMAQFNPNVKNRVLLAAHWDTRMVADKDEDESKRNDAIDGADDGASGTAALIEIARLLQSEPMKNMGVDILFFDLEDQGGLDGVGEEESTYALGSLYWSENVVPTGYKAEFGILLDMIAAKGATFGIEEYSKKYAGMYLDKIWSTAKKMGKGHLFQDYEAGAIGDDHVNVIKAGIPMVDIINRPMKTKHGFGHYHHTHKDDISIIDKSILQSVGQVVTTVIYRQAVGRL